MISLAWLQPLTGYLLLAAVAFYALALLLLDAHRRTHSLPLRQIPLYDRLRTLTSRALETDAPLHLSLGSGALLTNTPQVAAVCALAESLASTAMPAAICTCGAATLFVAAAGALAGPGARGADDGAAMPQLALVGAEPLALAAGAWGALERQELAGEVHLGPFGAEGLLLAEGRGGRAPERLAGTVEPDAAGVLLLGATAWAVGEDIYAASAHIRDRSHQGGLAVQDALRIGVLLAMLIGLGLRLAGWAGG